MLQERDIRSNVTKIRTNHCCEQVYRIIDQFDNIPAEQKEEPTIGKGTRKEAATAITTAIWEEAEKLRDQQPEHEAQNKRPKSEDTRVPKEEENEVQGKPTKARSSSLKQRSDAAKKAPRRVSFNIGTNDREGRSIKQILMKNAKNQKRKTNLTGRSFFTGHHQHPR